VNRIAQEAVMKRIEKDAVEEAAAEWVDQFSS
jgi:hypothetical protein